MITLIRIPVVAAAVLLVLLMTGCGASQYEAVITPQGFDESLEAEESQVEETDSSHMCFVYVCGAVHTPGVYQLPSGARVYQAIEAAGGLADDADERSINQAELIGDGQQITIPTKSEQEVTMNQATTPTATDNGISSDGKININTADAKTLQKLSGVGESRAQDIIAYREGNGGFKSIEDIMKVSGIKNALFEKIKDDITVG